MGSVVVRSNNDEEIPTFEMPAASERLPRDRVGRREVVGILTLPGPFHLRNVLASGKRRAI